MAIWPGRIELHSAASRLEEGWHQGRRADPEPDAELRDTEIVALPDDIALDGNEDIFVRLMNDEAFKSIAASHLMRAVYQQVRASVGERETSLK